MEEAQKKVKEEQAKLGSLLKRQESKHAAALEDLKKQHAGQLDGLLAQLKTHEQEVCSTVHCLSFLPGLLMAVSVKWPLLHGTR